MKLILIALVCCVCVSNAFAGGANVSANACPGVAGSSLVAGDLDCAGGGTLVLLITFQPQERITDLVAADAVVKLWVGPSGESTSSATFWDFSSANSAALKSSPLRPLGCSPYSPAFGVAGSASSVAAHFIDPLRIQIDVNANRPTPVTVLAEQKLFGMQLLVDLGTSLESGTGSFEGCVDWAFLALTELVPRSASGASVTSFEHTGDLTPYAVVVNPPPPGLPVARQSWGRLKSLYR